MALREPYALGRHAVGIWRFYIPGAIAAEVAIAEVVGDEQNDVWLLLLGQGGACCRCHSGEYPESHHRCWVSV